MSSTDIFQTQLSQIMGLLVESTVSEMGRLLDVCAAVLENKDNRFLKREMERVNITNKIKFASFMEVLSKSSMEKISLLVTVDEMEVRAVEKTGGEGTSGGEAVNLLDPEVKSRVIIICPGDIREAVATQKGAVKDEGSSESDSQEDYPGLAPLPSPSSDEEWLPEVDTSQGDDLDPQAPSASRLKIPRSASDPDKQDEGRDGDDQDVQCGDSADAAHQGPLICAHQGPLICSHCGKCFKEKWYLTRHLQSHTKSYRCSHCAKGFNLAKQLAKHSIKHQENTFSCTDCDAVFRQKCTLQSHKKRHKTEKTVTCAVCEKKFVGERHKCIVKQRTFSCSSCPKVLKTREGLSYHQGTHSGERKYCCETCGKTFFTGVSLKTHMMTHKEKDHSCTVCGQPFNNGHALRKHMVASHPGETPEKRFVCDVCGKCFAKRDHLYKHMRRHKEEKPFSCDVCGKKFHSSGNCKRHEITHTGEKLYHCDLCGKSFTQSGTLTIHKLNTHTDGDEKPSFKCEICGEVFPRRYTLKNHMVTHTGKKPCQCSVCGKGFFSNPTLKAHMLIHTGEKPFECDQCGKRFTQSSHLKYHERHVHTGVKPFVCDICGKAYANRQNLKLHKCSASAKQ
ncbi:oocyte zinc finger protein XlCOF6-like [Oncorhynchus clarkii lewisi]|uniref:oocyte zinc finger protein XlCOF6-like n=1 Tax=Oncorhynchus clarkii lewisi TaxID=490388 RepID=UPI0039B864AC